jgi:hypothetical protein
MAQCPVPDHGAGTGDPNPSLAITPIRGRVLVKCHAGCSTEAVVKHLGRNLSDLFDDRHGVTYLYEDGRQVKRNADKKFSQKGNRDGYALYGVEHIADAIHVYVCEGEQDVDAIAARGSRAVSSPMGAGNAHCADWTRLRGKNVTVIPDMDEAGFKHARLVAALLHGIAASVTFARAKVGKDAGDHIGHGFGIDEFLPFDLPGPAAEDADAGAERPRTLADELLTRDDLKALPNPEPLIEGTLDRGTTALLYGPWGSGKTFIALDWAASVATGRKWQGRPARKLRVLYIAAEGAFGS